MHAFEKKVVVAKGKTKEQLEADIVEGLKGDIESSYHYKVEDYITDSSCDNSGELKPADVDPDVYLARVHVELFKQ